MLLVQCCLCSASLHLNGHVLPSKRALSLEASECREEDAWWHSQVQQNLLHRPALVLLQRVLHRFTHRSVVVLHVELEVVDLVEKLSLSGCAHAEGTMAVCALHVAVKYILQKGQKEKEIEGSLGHGRITLAARQAARTRNNHNKKYKNLRMYLWWSLCTLYLHACQVSYRRQLWSLSVYLCYLF